MNNQQDTKTETTWREMQMGRDAIKCIMLSMLRCQGYQNKSDIDELVNKSFLHQKIDESWNEDNK